MYLDSGKEIRKEIFEWCFHNAPMAIRNESKEFIVENMLGSYANTVLKVNESQILYFGTRDKNFVPDPNYKNYDTDLGPGLYLSSSLERAKEWATCMFSKGSGDGYAYAFLYQPTKLNTYEFKKTDMVELVTVLAHNRKVLRRLTETPNYVKLFNRYYIDLEQFDVVSSYIVDDGLMWMVRDFIQGMISDNTLYSAISLCSLGKQVCVKSIDAYNCLTPLFRFDAKESLGKKFDRNYLYSKDKYGKLNKVPGKMIQDYLF